jgi:hypothetical protein
VARLLTVIGDSWSSGQPGIGGLGVKGWPTLVARRKLGGDFQNWAVGGTGYVNNAGGHTFQIRAQIVAPESQTVIVFGSLNDQTIAPASVGTAATATYQTIRSRAPGARLVVIGPQWPNANAPRTCSPSATPSGRPHSTRAPSSWTRSPRAGSTTART